jgi:hypothetical protein
MEKLFGSCFERGHLRFVFLNQFYLSDLLPTTVVLVALGHEVTVLRGQSMAGSMGVSVDSRP